jgi:pantothenate kinase
MTRRMIGFGGAPGAGKTRYAGRLLARAERDDTRAAYLPMDGFHLADVALTSLGILDRTGAPETFDAWGYAAMLRRLRGRPDHIVWAPGFDRVLEQPLAGAVRIGPEVDLVVTEGNYLLLDRPEWRAVRAELDEVWFLDCADDVRRPRLIARHIEFGKSPADAEAWVSRVDDANAALVATTRTRADRVVES